MIEVKDLGVKIAQSPMEKLIEEALEATEKRVLSTELALELEKNTLEYLKNKKLIGIPNN